MRAIILDSKDLNKMSLQEIKNVYIGRSLEHLTLENLKVLYKRISLNSSSISKLWKEKKSSYVDVLEGYFKSVSEVRSLEQLSLF